MPFVQPHKYIRVPAYTKALEQLPLCGYIEVSMDRIYFDWAATAPPETDILEQVRDLSAQYTGNPSSLHKEGRAAREKLEWCRARTASLLGARPEQIIFTSGGTESDNLILFSLLGPMKSGGLLTAGFEHPAVWQTAQALKELGLPVKELTAPRGGVLDPREAAEGLSREIRMISLMAVNNETGARQPIKELVHTFAETRSGNGPALLFHTDAVQALGKEPIDLSDWGVDAASFSGHKIGAPRGAGALFLKKPRTFLFRGGGQEGGFRSGTENLGGIYGFTLALERRCTRMEAERAAAKKIKALMVEGMKRIPGARVFPSPERALSDDYSPFILSVSFPPLPGEVLARVMDDNGVAVSTGSACSSRNKKQSRVMKAQGVDEKTAFSTLRFSWGPGSTVEEAEQILKILAAQVEILGSFRRRR